MKKLISVLILIGIAGHGFAQELSQVTLQGGRKFIHFGILFDRLTLLRISEDGKIIEYGQEEQSLRNPNYYAPKLQPYLGRVDTYGNEADSLVRGKIKSIGTAVITYYPSYDNEYRRGKIHTIGNLMIDYYDARSTDAQKGKIRQIGRNTIDYYALYENEAFRGNLKAVGSTTIVYYSSFDDKAITGKVKSIGGQNYVWYTSMDRQGAGALKSGPQRYQTGQVTYVVQ